MTGRVIEGMDIIKKVEGCGARNGVPRSKVSITDCGVMTATSTDGGDGAAAAALAPATPVAQPTIAAKPWYQVW